MTFPALDRSRPPKAGPVRPFRFPPFVRRRLDNGLTVLAARQEKTSLVRLELAFAAGTEHNRPAQAGLASFTGLLLEEGTKHRDALEIAASVERLGGRLATGATWDIGSLSLELLGHHRRQGLGLITELALEPSFPVAEIERLRKRRQAELIRLASDPAFLARDRFRRRIYGDAPYGRSPVGTARSLAAFERDQIETFYRRHYRFRGAVAAVIGDQDPEVLVDEVAAVLGHQDSAEAPATPASTPTHLTGTEVHLVDRPGAAQTQLLIGHEGLARTDPDFMPMAVMTSLLGGKFTSRINLNLRERHGYTYGAACQMSIRRGPAPLTVSAAVANEVAGAAARQVLYELNRIREEKVGADELEDTQNYLIGVFPYTLQTVSALATRLENFVIYDLPDDYYDTYPEAVRAVDRDTVLTVARRYLHPERLLIVAAGPAAELEGQFAEMGPVTVHQPAV
ncbi:MAG: pitrilysin family protein [Acidobacteriota bacterium]